MTFCTRCGQQLAQQARFCENCGTPTGAMTGAMPSESSPGTPARSSRRTRRALLTGAGVVVAVGVLGSVGYLAYDRLIGPSGGADTPAAAVLELSAAAGGEDPLTALSLLPPDEVGPVLDLYRDVATKATSSGIAAEENPFAGFDLRLEDVQVETDKLAEDVAAVTVTSGSISWAFDPEQVQAPLSLEPDGDLRRPSAGSADLVAVTHEAADGAPMRIMTVQRDGRWYVSPVYTLLELWRANEGLPAPDFSQPLELDGTGAESATAAVEEAVQAVASYDVDGFIDLLSPGEAGALHHYRAAITMALNRNGDLAELRSAAQLSVDRVDATAGAEVDGHVPVTVRSASGSISANGDYYSWNLDRNCVSYSGNGDSGGGCLDSLTAAAGLGRDLAGQFPELTLLTVEDHGRWYLSPLATIVTSVRNAVAAMPGDDVLSVLGVPQFGTVTAQLGDGTAIEGSFQTPLDHALYEMDVPAGAVFNACTDGDVYLLVYGPDGRPVSGDAVMATEGGAYRVLVGGYGDGGSSYTLTGQASAVAELTVPGQVAAGGGDACGDRMLRFQATEGQPLMFSTASGDTPIVSDGSGTTYSGAMFIPPASGEYVVSAPADTSLAVEALPAGVLASGSTVTGAVTSSGPAQFQLFVPAGQTVQVVARGVDGFDSVMELRSMTGRVLARGDDDYGSDAAVSYYSTSSTVYELVVTGYAGLTGDFEVQVQGY